MLYQTQYTLNQSRIKLNFQKKNKNRESETCVHATVSLKSIKWNHVIKTML